MAAKEITIVQTDTNIAINRLQTDVAGKDITTYENLLCDGKQLDIQTSTEDRIKKVVLIPNASGLTEFTEVTYAGTKNEIDYSITENWKLSDDANRLTVKCHFNFNNGKTTVVAVYDKK